MARLSEPEARAWLIAHAAMEPTEVAGVRIGRGQVCASVRALSHAWGWSRGSTGRFLDRLEGDGWIARAYGTPQTVLTLCEYERIAGVSPIAGTADALSRLRARISRAIGVDLGPESLAQRAVLRRWLALAGGDAARVATACAEGWADATAAMVAPEDLTAAAGWIEPALLRVSEIGRAPPDRQCAPAAVRRWLLASGPEASRRMIYHCGALAADRLASPVLDATADYVAALADLGALHASQIRTADDAVTVYTITRGVVDPAHPLVTGRLSPTLWRALRALATRYADQSAVRVVRDGARVSEAQAERLVDELRQAGAIRYDAEDHTGVALSAESARIAGSPHRGRKIGH